MQRLEKILKEIKEMLEDNKVIELNSDGTIDKCVIDAKLAWDYIKDIIRKHINDGWISVEDRLPEDGTYLCTFKGELCGIEEPFTGMCGMENGVWDEPGYVTAWQPLPEPYRPERSEGE